MISKGMPQTMGGPVFLHLGFPFNLLKQNPILGFAKTTSNNTASEWSFDERGLLDRKKIIFPDKTIEKSYLYDERSYLASEGDLENINKLKGYLYNASGVMVEKNGWTV